MKNFTFLIAFLCLFAFSCVKTSVTPSSSPTYIVVNNDTLTTTLIGTQTWTSVNYNGPGGTNYNNSNINVPLAGKLYTWQETQAITSSLPAGWRIPTQADAIKLIINSGGFADTQFSYGAFGDPTVAAKLKSKTGWTSEGNNITNFNALPVGEQDANIYQQAFQVAEFWTSTSRDSNDQYTLHITDFNGGDNVSVDYIPIAVYGTYALSVRFVKDN